MYDRPVGAHDQAADPTALVGVSEIARSGLWFSSRHAAYGDTGAQAIPGVASQRPRRVSVAGGRELTG
jgi:hypothetical protein